MITVNLREFVMFIQAFKERITIARLRKCCGMMVEAFKERSLEDERLEEKEEEEKKTDEELKGG